MPSQKTPAILAAAAFGAMLTYSVPASANTSNVEIGTPLISATEVSPDENVTVNVAITCAKPKPGSISHGGCTNTSPDVNQGSVEFFAYLPDNLPSCDADPAADKISLGIDADGVADGWSVAFTPDGQGLVEGNVYFIRVEYTGVTAGKHGTANSDFNSGCTGAPTLMVENQNPIVQISVQTELVSGPTEDDDITDIFPNPPEPDPFNDGLIYVDLTVPQYFVYNIIIANDDPGAIDLVVSDVVSDVFDIDNRPPDHGVFSDNLACVVTLDQPPATGGKEAEFVMVDVPAGQSCTVEVHLVTVPSPGSAELFEPLFAAVRALGTSIDRN